jgi:hypothetical protein
VVHGNAVAPNRRLGELLPASYHARYSRKRVLGIMAFRLVTDGGNAGRYSIFSLPAGYFEIRKWHGMEVIVVGCGIDHESSLTELKNVSQIE